ncbi:MAG: ABC transporter permease [Thermoanaerobaculia bacterium]|nr:ABC transporter permease [Thermoanaerobaculia bacterium]
MERTFQNVRFALRTLRKNWGVTALVVVSLSLAIAGNTIVYSLINALLYRPLPYEEPNRILLVGERSESTPAGFVLPASMANFLDLEERQRSFQSMAAFQNLPMGIDRGGDSLEPVTAARVSPEFFDLLGETPGLGRSFLEEEGVLGRHRVAILDYDYWRDEHGASDDIVGTTLNLNGEPYEVVGVTSPDFEFLQPGIQVWVPLAVDRAGLRRSDRLVLLVARLNDGIAQSAAAGEMSALYDDLKEQYPEANRGYLMEMLNLREEIPDARNRLFFKMLQGAMIFVVLIACANIANLLMARSQKREREIAVRTSIGAGRRQIVAQLFTESLVMATVAGAIGIGLGYLGVEQMRRSFGALLPEIYAPVVDTRVLLYTLGVTVFGGLLFGLAPVLQTARMNLVDALKDGAAASTSGGRKRFASKFLVVGELTLALIFLGGSGILLKSFDSLQNQDAGFETSNLLTVQVQVPEERFPTDPEKVVAVEGMVERLEQVAGVDAALVSNILPRFIFVPQDNFIVDSAPPPEDQAPPQVSYLTTSPGLFEQLDIQLVEGRLLDSTDRNGGAPVAVVNRAVVESFFEGQSPIGQTVTLVGESRRIVGVVEDVRHVLTVGRDVSPTVYLPWSQLPASALFVTLATQVSPESLTQPVRRTLFEYDPGLAVSQIQSLDAVIDQFWAGQRIISAILQGFGSLALLLAAIGTYGVLAYSVALRRQEIGVRMALGASRREVVTMVMRQGLFLGAIGLVLGLPGIMGVKALLEQVMAGFVPVEMVGMGAAVSVMVGVILLASFLPARSAASVDPIKALRWE